MMLEPTLTLLKPVRSLVRLIQRQRAAAVWLLCASLFALYSLVPESDDSLTRARQVQAERDDGELRRPTIVDISPDEPAAGSVITVTYEASSASEQPQLRAGKRSLHVLASRPGSLVAQLPKTLPYGPIRIKLVQGTQRSKSFELRIKPFNWQKLLRNACGGLALLILGVQVLARGVLSVLSVANAKRVAMLTRSRWLLLGLGTLLGAGMQSTTAAAGLLAGVVGSRVLSISAAASLFLGAQLGTALAPWLLGSITEPRSGLIAIAIGGLALTLSLDRRSKAVAQLLVGAGLVAFGVQVLRPGFEPFASNPLLLSTLDRLSPAGVTGGAFTTLLGALLVALFQGPAPVLALALGIAETTGHENLRTTLFMLAGTGFGAGLGALLILPGSAQSRRFVAVSLIAGLGSTVLSLLTLDGFAWLTARWAESSPHMGLHWGKHVLPDVSWQIAAAFGLSQLVSVCLLLPLLPYLERFSAAIRRRLGASLAREPLSQPSELLTVARGTLLRAISAQHAALPDIYELALHGTRSAGVSAELQLQQARLALNDLLRGPVTGLADSAASETLGRLALSAMQLQGALENLLRAAEQLTETRLTDDESTAGASALSAEPALRQMHQLLCDGIVQLQTQLHTGVSNDADEARAREIEMNHLEARTRRRMLAHLRDSPQLETSLPLLALSDAYESTGNQLFRMAEVLEQAEIQALELDEDTKAWSARATLAGEQSPS